MVTIVQDLLERPLNRAVAPDAHDYPTPEEEEAAYAVPPRIVPPAVREEPRVDLAGCVPACWERWDRGRSCRDRNRIRRSRFVGR